MTEPVSTSEKSEWLGWDGKSSGNLIFSPADDVWSIEDGMILGNCPHRKWSKLFIDKKDFTDFELIADVALLSDNGFHIVFYDERKRQLGCSFSLDHIGRVYQFDGGRGADPYWSPSVESTAEKGEFFLLRIVRRNDIIQVFKDEALVLEKDVSDYKKPSQIYVQKWSEGSIKLRQFKARALKSASAIPASREVGTRTEKESLSPISRFEPNQVWNGVLNWQEGPLKQHHPDGDNYELAIKSVGLQGSKFTGAYRWKAINVPGLGDTHEFSATVKGDLATWSTGEPKCFHSARIFDGKIEVELRTPSSRGVAVLRLSPDGLSGSQHNSEDGLSISDLQVDGGKSASEEKDLTEVKPVTKPKLPTFEYRTKHYHVFSDNITWSEAQNRCIEMGGGWRPLNPKSTTT